MCGKEGDRGLKQGKPGANEGTDHPRGDFLDYQVQQRHRGGEWGSWGMVAPVPVSRLSLESVPIHTPYWQVYSVQGSKL